MSISEDLSAASIAALGVERLGALLADLAERIPAVRVAVETAIAAATDPKQAAARISAEIDKVRRDDKCIEWNEFPAFERELSALLDSIIGTLADADPALAFDCLCEFIEMGGSVLNRSTDEGMLFEDACDLAGPLVVRIPPGEARNQAIGRARQTADRDEIGIASELVEVVVAAISAAEGKAHAHHP